MRTLSSFVIAIAMMAAPAAVAQPLAPGKPAGVRQAQITSTEWFVLGGVAALGIGIAIATSGGRSSNVPPQTVTVAGATGP